MLPISSLLDRLAAKRPIFHSEADFQHAFAWELHQMFPAASLRLEKPTACSGSVFYVDLIVEEAEHRYGFELKYKTAQLRQQVDNEDFLLRNHAAQDCGRYDFIKDIVRLEQLIRQGTISEGYAILITNDSQYWNGGRQGTTDKNFRLPEGRKLHGALAWAPHTGAGTMKHREEPLVVHGEYSIEWKDYSQLGSSSPQVFRRLVVSVRDA